MAADAKRKDFAEIQSGEHIGWFIEADSPVPELPFSFFAASCCNDLSLRDTITRCQQHALTAEEICLNDGSPDAKYAAEQIHQLSEGWAQTSSGNFCIVLDMAWVFEIGAGSEWISAFLRQLQSHLTGEPVSVIYRFDRALFKASLLFDLLAFFPALILDEHIYENPYFRASPQKSQADPLAGALGEVLEKIRALGAIEQILHERSRKLEQSENALRMLESIMDSMGDGVFVVDACGDMIFCNKSSENILGYGLLDIPLEQRVRIIGNYLPDMVTTFPTFDLPVARAIRGESSDGVEIFIKNDRRPKGVFISTTGRPLRKHDGELAGGVIVFRDITKQKEAALERERLEEQMFRTQKLESLGVLAGGIAHDFNNLLMGVLGNADLALLDVPPDSPLHRRVSHIGVAARRLGELTNQLLAYSGKGNVLDERLNLSNLVREMIDLLRPAISKKAQVEFELATDLPAIEADPTQVRQVVMNLITNASDALSDRPGNIRVRTELVTATAELFARSYLADNLPSGPYIMVEIADSGCGMDKETLAKIFDPFFTTKFTGRGLGLAAVLGIMRRHRGAVAVDSEMGTGTTFRVFFPAARTAALSEEMTVTRMTSLWHGSGTVLVVDDEETVLDVASDMLRVLGFDILKASTGKEALALFQQHRRNIRLVLLDLTMPDMNGEEIYDAMREISSSVKVILSSGYHEFDTFGRFPQSDISGFLQKPYGSDALVGALQQALPSL